MLRASLDTSVREEERAPPWQSHPSTPEPCGRETVGPYDNS